MTDKKSNEIVNGLTIAEAEPKKPYEAGRWGVRHMIIGQLFLCLTVAYALRVNLSVAIVAMTDNSANPDFKVYSWNEQIKSLLLSSFFWGYVITQIPAGQMAEKYGAKMILCVAMILVSILTMLTPIVAEYGGWQLICALRLMEGLCQGVIFPSCHTLLSKWAPIMERAQLGTYMYSGSQFGTVVLLASSGVLSSSSFGWPSLFYIPATGGLIWAIMWFFYGANSPAEYSHISPEEREFIVESSKSDDDQNEKKEYPRTPWLSIFTSMPFLSILIVHSTHNWGFWTLLTEMPTYMKSVLQLDIKKNALLSSLPYTAMFLMSFVFSYLANMLAKYNCVPLKYSRKLFNSIGHWIPMCAMIGLGYATKDETGLAVALLTLAVGINGATYLGFQCNHIDLAPNFAGTMMGITNCVANIMAIIAPLTVGFIVHDETDPGQWRIVFFVSAAIYFVGNLLFVIFSKTEVQPWNEPKRSEVEQNGVKPVQNGINQC